MDGKKKSTEIGVAHMALGETRGALSAP